MIRERTKPNLAIDVAWPKLLVCIAVAGARETERESKG